MFNVIRNFSPKKKKNYNKISRKCMRIIHECVTTQLSVATAKKNTREKEEKWENYHHLKAQRLNIEEHVNRID